MPTFVHGYATIFDTFDNGSDTMAKGCLDGFLQEPDHLSIPMLNAHQGEPIGHWLSMHADPLGLHVVGELYSRPDLSQPLGLSILPVDAKGSPKPTAQGGRLGREIRLAEISIVLTPRQPACVAYFFSVV